MLGGCGLILGIAGLFGSAAAAGYTSNDIKGFDALGAYQRSVSEPTPKERAVCEKWRGKRINNRKETYYTLMQEHHCDDADGQRIWWEHVFEDEKVEVNPHYLDRISGVHERALRYKAEQIGKKRRGW